VTAVVVLILGVGLPWGWYKHKNGARSTSDASAATPSMPAPVAEEAVNNAQPQTVEAQAEPSPATEAAEWAKRQRELHARDRAKGLEQFPNPGNTSGPKPLANVGTANVPIVPTASNKRATVQVTYDENGRVTAASGGDATALRIARQKRFPPGKPGSATVTIPIN
jgi:hypothetical protein